MKIQGLVCAFNQVRAKLQTGLAPSEIEPFRHRVQSVVRAVEALCHQHGMTPQQLPGPSRQAYTFLRELDLDHLPVNQTDAPAATPVFRLKNVVKLGEQWAARCWQQLEALPTSAATRAQLEQELTRQVSSIERLFAQQTTTLWQRRVYQDAVLLKINVGFLSAEPQIWQAIMHNALTQRDPAHDHLIREYAESEEFSEVLFAIESCAATTTASRRGRVHDLDDSFARVNAAYFDNQMPKPTLVWNRTLTARKFGHYQASRDTVMLSVSLDDARVPAFVVDFVLYHELLHKTHGALLVNGRRSVHSPSFRAEERRFAKYQQAEQQLHELALRQRGLWQEPMSDDNDT